ncbi:hypothetical protein [Bartonella taylorii]|uniref:hypothetical protein n=1 Tax=Bartonella taylorii TaxID=33046 RepID=UPI001ABB156C|nr:hypothetical protein [Bartonella taylorii]
MALFPFSIADIDDPEHIRVVLYASGRMGHAPLNALLKQTRQDLQCFDKIQTQNILQLTQRLDILEKQLKTIIKDLEDVKQNAKQSGKEGEQVMKTSN